MSEIQRYGLFGPSDHGAVVRFTDHEAAIALRTRVCAEAFEDELARTEERVLADAKARIEDLHYGDDNLLIGTGYQLAVNDALAALTQPQAEIHINSESEPSDEDKAIVGDLVNRAVDRMKSDGGGAATEKCPEDCDGFGQLIGDSDGPCPACSGLESDGGGAATAAGVADGDLVARAMAVFNSHIEAERDLEHGGMICSECGFHLGDLPVLHTTRQDHAFRMAFDATGQQEAVADSQPGPYAKTFRERVCPVPEFPGIKNRQEDQA